MKIQTVNPATEEILETYEYLNENLIKEKIKKGHEVYLSWKKTSFSHRKNLMLQLAALMEKRKEQLAIIISNEMGKPIKFAQSEIEKCAWVCKHYAEHAESYLSSKVIQTEMKKAEVSYHPLGIVLAIMPWNFPFWQVFRFAAPTIMAGNGAVLKHASISLGAGNAIEQLFKDAGFPEHLFQHLIVDKKGVETVIANPHIVAVTLTGSERAGREVAAQAGKCLKKTVLELGGSDPYIILEDADLDLAAQCIVESRLNNSGQVCIAAKRILVLQTVEQKLIEKIKDRISQFKMGNPLDADVDLGPLARKDLRNNLQEQVEKTRKQGAKLLCGGIIPSGKGFYYPATLLTGVKPGMVAFEEELFGPVIAIISVISEQEAISYANHSSFGLGAAVFTKDLKKGERIATNEIEAGVCFVNSVVASDPRLPFGGIKSSGYGRELSKEGILEFVNTKTIAIGNTR